MFLRYCYRSSIVLPLSRFNRNKSICRNPGFILVSLVAYPVSNSNFWPTRLLCPYFGHSFLKYLQNSQSLKGMDDLDQPLNACRVHFVWSVYKHCTESFCILLALSVDVLKVFALGNIYFFTSISLSTTENTDLLLGRGPALEILFCSDNKEHDRLTGKWVFTCSSLQPLWISIVLMQSFELYWFVPAELLLGFYCLSLYSLKISLLSSKNPI